MKVIKGSVAGLAFAGILALLPAAAFTRGGGGGHFGGFAGHRFAPHEGAHFGSHAWYGGPYWGWYGDPSWYDYPYDRYLEDN
jgi:hypothetical protein